MSGNEFWNFFLLGAVELPSNLLGWWGIQTLGRRWTAAGACLLAALGVLVTALLTRKYRRLWAARHHLGRSNKTYILLGAPESGLKQVHERFCWLILNCFQCHYFALYTLDLIGSIGSYDSISLYWIIYADVSNNLLLFVLPKICCPFVFQNL